MKKVMLVFGTRPEAVKMCPVVKELKARDSWQVVVCVTGQHKEMLQQVLDAFAVVPDYNLEVMKENQTLFDVTIQVLSRIRPVLEKETPDLVLVHGDTTTTFAAALAAFYLHIPVGHVEAGLRTYQLSSPFPEEFNRQCVGILATYHFAPTDAARRNLLREQKRPDFIYVTGNTGIDALKTTVCEGYEHAHLEWAKGSRLILLTAHRRENLGEPLYHMFHAVMRIVEEFLDVKVIYPVHKNPTVRKAAEEVFAGHGRVRLIEPLEVVDFHNFMAHAYLILTDSGGIQEEAPSLGRPVLVMRDTTERPEGAAAGTLKLVGTDEEVIYRECKKLLADSGEYALMSRASNPYGDGRAGGRIADILEGLDRFNMMQK